MSSPHTSAPSGTLRFFSNSPKEKAARALYLKVFLGGIFMVIVMVFTILPIYWGALWKIPAHNLDGWVVDFDGGLIGERVSQALQSSQVSSLSRITWRTKSANEFNGSPEELVHAVREERTWAAIAILPNTSSDLTSALASPNPSYDGSRSIIAYAVEARNENGFRSIIRPSIDAALGIITRQISLQVSQQLTSSGATPESDARIAQILRTAPQTLVAPVGYTLDNLIPFDQPVATAATFVGMLYQLIMSFFVVMISLAAREASGYAHHMKVPGLIGLRIASSFFAYCLISLFYCLLNLAFHLHVDRKFGPGGFMVFWMVNWIGTLAVGMALESMITLLTPKGIPFFMLLWIIVNLSTCIFPIQVLPGIFRYGYAMPFYNLSRAIRTIVFGTKNSLGEIVGILIAWVVVSCITLTFFQWFIRRGSPPDDSATKESSLSTSSHPSLRSQKQDSQSKRNNGTDVDAVDAAVLDIDEEKANA